MNSVKVSLGILSAVFLFASGVYVHSLLSQGPTEHMPSGLESSREPAAAKFDARATEAFRGCLDSRIKSSSISIGKVVVEGRRWSIVSIACTGAPAKALYDTIQPYSSEEYVRYRDKRRGVVRFFGRLFPPSQCVQLIGSAHGMESNEYSCSIRIDVDHELTEQLRL